MTANPHRGEVPIDLAGRTFALRPTYQAMVEIEQTLGEGLVPLARRLHEQRYGLNDLATILTAGLRATGEPATREKVGALILETGFPSVSEAAMTFLANALTGGQAGKEGGPAGRTMSPTAG